MLLEGPPFSSVPQINEKEGKGKKMEAGVAPGAHDMRGRRHGW
jgi:hypothetical protein